MPKYVIPPPPRVGVPVTGSDELFPVRRIYCVGQNYSAHVKEMGGDERNPPFFFQKPADSVVLNGSDIPYPTLTKDLHFEIELVMAISESADHVSLEQAAKHVFGLAAGIDLTRRDLQAIAKSTGRPWEIAKAFDHAAPITAITPLNGAPLPMAGAISLAVNGTTRQAADLADMTWNCHEIIATLSTHYRLEPGDLIFTGTPSGVGPTVPGDTLVGTIDGLPVLEVHIVE